MDTKGTERTEQGDRPGLDDGKYKGIGRHPLARRWLKRLRDEARAEGRATFAKKIEARMKACGMRVTP